MQLSHSYVTAALPHKWVIDDATPDTHEDGARRAPYLHCKAKIIQLDEKIFLRPKDADGPSIRTDVDPSPTSSSCCDDSSSMPL